MLGLDTSSSFVTGNCRTRHSLIDMRRHTCPKAGVDNHSSTRDSTRTRSSDSTLAHRLEIALGLEALTRHSLIDSRQYFCCNSTQTITKDFTNYFLLLRSYDLQRTSSNFQLGGSRH
eukprot:3603256-Rhodomonas_salina.1